MTNAIELKNIKIKYGKQIVIDDVSFHIKKNSFTVLIGKNGSGKSTLVKSILNLLKYKGDIMLNNKNINDFSAKDLAKNIAYVPQIIDDIQPTSVYDYISFGRFPHSGSRTLSKIDKKVIENTMERLNVKHLRDKSVTDLSGGQRQKVALATALVQEAEIIILDEPTTYLDMRNQYEILEIAKLLKEENKTIVAVLHEFNQVIKYADDVVVVHNKTVYMQDKPKQIFKSSILKEIFDIEVKFSKETHFIEDINTDGIIKAIKR